MILKKYDIYTKNITKMCQQYQYTIKHPHFQQKLQNKSIEVNEHLMDENSSKFYLHFFPQASKWTFHSFLFSNSQSMLSLQLMQKISKRELWLVLAAFIHVHRLWFIQQQNVFLKRHNVLLFHIISFLNSPTVTVPSQLIVAVVKKQFIVKPLGRIPLLRT